jgi:hypothetical protein
MRRRLTSCVLAIAIAVGAVAATGEAASGSTAAPAAPESLAAISCVSAKFCVAVGTGQVNAKGETGAISLFWNGAKWRRVAMKQPTPGPDSFAGQSVSCKSATYCVAVGSDGFNTGVRPFAQTWNGKTWTLTLMPESASAVGVFASSVSCAAARKCVAAGAASTAGGDFRPLVETLAGTKWTIRALSPVPGSIDTFFSAVSCPSATLCVLAGQYDTATFTRALYESWNGTKFTRMSAAPTSGVVATTGVSCVSAKSCAAAAFRVQTTYHAFAQVWNGEKWTAGAVRWPSPTALMNAVSCTAGRCMLTGSTGRDIGQNAAGSRAAAAVYNGKTWTAVTVPGPPKDDLSVLNGVSCLSATFCAAVGQVGPATGATSAGLIGFWNGKTWRLLTVS